MNNIQILNDFDLNNIPDLDIAVLGALELFKDTSLPKLNLDKYQRPLVVGSGNAELTGRIIFGDKDAIFASENNYEEKLKNIKNIDGVVLISASGSKHAPVIAKVAKKYDKSVMLLTNTPDSLASRELDKKGDEEHVFPKNREPYTYNTSTYMGMIFAYTKENSEDIQNFIEKNIDILDFSKLSLYDKFVLIIPTEFYGIVEMLKIKFIELFGRRLARDVETMEHMSHALTVIPSKELFISFGIENKIWGNEEDSMYIPLPEKAKYGAMMAIGYYIVGKIQKEHPSYFKENIVEYVKHSSSVFGQEIKAIVE